MRTKNATAFALIALAILLASPAAAAGESAVSLGRDITEQAADRDRLARSITFHDFENRRDPDTGALLPESADFNLDGWPDFWEPMRAVGFPEYLISGITIVEDQSGQIPGRYRDVPNHVLRLSYDGTRVGVRTREPTPVDASQAYEFSLRTRDSGLAGASIRAGVDWLRVDPAAVELLRTDSIPDISTGQLDWPVIPWRMRINDPPPDANAARLFVMVERDPEAVGGDYHGEILLDDIAFDRRPRIGVSAARAVDGGSQSIPVTYTGLFDNVPDPATPGYFKGKSYFRRVDITDVFDRPLGRGGRRMAPIDSDETGVAVENLAFPRDRFGVYYLNIRLYDADQRLITDALRAVAVMKPMVLRDELSIRPTRPMFGLRAGVVPDAVLSRKNFLRDILVRGGARQTKISPWRDTYAHPGENAPYYAFLTEELKGMRAAGIGVTGLVAPPAAMFGSVPLAQTIQEYPERLKNIVDEAGRALGLFMDSWQWGDDTDDGLAGSSGGKGFDLVADALGEFAGGLPIAWNLGLGKPKLNFPRRPKIVNAYMPTRAAADSLWPMAAELFPWLFEAYFMERGLIYPPPELSRLAPKPAADMVEERERLRDRTAVWLSLESEPANPREPNAAAEKAQLEQLLVRAVYASVASPEAVFLGDLFEPARGLLRNGSSRTVDTLETLARPAFLAAATASGMLEGAEYLGRLGLLPPFEAHAFRRPGADAAVIVIWHNAAAEEMTLPVAEIAAGPALEITDWAGNVDPVGQSIPVGRVPAFITGLPASLALTRMSVRIAPEPPLLAATRRQNQTLEIINHMAIQAPVRFRARFAARPEDGAMEGGWTVAPDELRVNLPPGQPNPVESRSRFTVVPDPDSPIQRASPVRVDKSGRKIARVQMGVATSPPADMILYLPFELKSELDVDIMRLERVDDPNFVTLQLKIRWFPSEANRRRAEIRVTPFYLKRGQMKERAAFPVAVKPQPPEARDNPGAAFESVELRIPRTPRVRTWVGLDESGGSGFYLADVTELIP